MVVFIVAIENARKLSNYNKLIYKLKSHPENFEHTGAPIKNKDVLKLLELSKTMSKTEAIQFAVQFTIDNFGQKAILLSSIEAKFEKLRYAKEETHKLSDELLDT